MNFYAVLHFRVMKEERIVTCKNRYTGKTVEVPSSQLRFRPSAYGVLIEGDNVLLNPQWDGFDLPGGGVDLGETVEAGLIREFKEETGLDVDKDKLLHVQDDFFTSSIRSDLHFHSLLYYFSCKNPRGEVTDAFFEPYEKEYMQTARWIPLSDIDSLKFYSPVDCPAIIRMAAEGKGL
jgi:ADP-ribose pyrophosphatase YjhB (NUDIX family)